MQGHLTKLSVVDATKLATESVPSFVTFFPDGFSQNKNCSFNLVLFLSCKRVSPWKESIEGEAILFAHEKRRECHFGKYASI